jgi:hypothetical protein
VIGNARFSTHSHPVGFALKDGSMRVARWHQVWLLASPNLLSCRLDFGNSMGMVFLEELKLMFDLRHPAGGGENFPIGFGFP